MLLHGTGYRWILVRSTLLTYMFKWSTIFTPFVPPSLLCLMDFTQSSVIYIFFFDLLVHLKSKSSDNVKHILQNRRRAKTVFYLQVPQMRLKISKSI